VDLSRTVEDALASLAPEATRLLVAVSGGADSVAALRLLCRAGRSLVVAHLDHGIRPESSQDADFVRALCAELDLPLVEERVEVAAVAERRGWNLEDAARRVRYGFLRRAAAAHGCDVIVVAHTLDDQAETFMLQALRGSAYPAGMPARRGLVVRPLLSVERDALRQYLGSLGQAWREDPSNLDLTRSRAWLRNEVMPVLTRRYPHAARHLARTAIGLGEANAALDGVAARLFGSGPLRVATLAKTAVAVRRAALVRLIESEGLAPNADLVEAVEAAVGRAAREPASGPWRRSVGHDAVVRVAYGRVTVARPQARVVDADIPVPGPEAWLEAARALPPDRLADLADLPDSAQVAAWAARHADLVLRHRRAGDSVALPGGHKLLSDLLIDRKVPAEERDGLVLLAAGSDVLWVAGVPLDGHGSRDERFMRLALEQAERAATSGELPVGAVLVSGDRVVAAGHNRSEATGDPSAHAELEVLRAAGAAEGDWRLTGTTLYVTLEPCPMCFGAVLQTHVARVVYGADNLREGAVGGVMDLRVGPWKRVPAVEGGVLEARCRRLLSDFFGGRRGSLPGA